jgi:hypothetical protein
VKPITMDHPRSSSSSRRSSSSSSSSSTNVRNTRRLQWYDIYFRLILILPSILLFWMSEIVIVRVISLSNTNTNNNNNNNNVNTKSASSFFGSVLQDDILGITTSTTTTVDVDVSISYNPINDNNDGHDNNLPNKRGYWCEYCSCGFNKKKSYIEHVGGKRHKAVIVEGEMIWKEYIDGHHGSDNDSDSDNNNNNSTSSTSSAFYDGSVTKMDVMKAWSLDLFMEGIQARSRSSKKKSVLSGMIGGMDSSGRMIPSSSLSSSLSSGPGSSIGNNVYGGGGNQIDPSIRLCDLPPSKRGALFRYLHESSSGIPGLTDMVSSLPSRYVRVKELLESIEVYFHVVNMILKRSTEQGRKAKRLTRVYDIGCGHGLVGMLIAAMYPNIVVHSIDLVPRDSFVAQCDAFRSTGTALDNLSFETGDLSLIRNNYNDQKRLDDGDNDSDDDENGSHPQEDTEHTLVLCVHGCKELTHESIELAKENNWAWLSVPCCLQANDHLNENTSLKIKSDHTRYAMLCGAIAANHNPDTVSTIDSRITGRGIVLASSGK